MLENYHKEYYQTHKEKITERQKEYYRMHKKEISRQHKHYRQEHKVETRDYNRKYKGKNKIIMNDLKINGCAICGYGKCDRALSFHHVNPKDKKFNINIRSLAFLDKRIIDELNKCILLCSNCHREIHAKEE